MASYLNKINQKKMTTESGKIAYCIELIKRYGYDLLRDERDIINFTDDPIELFDDISIRSLRDAFIYEVSKPVLYKSNRYWCKYVQVGLDWEGTKKMLDAQPWFYL